MTTTLLRKIMLDYLDGQAAIDIEEYDQINKAIVELDDIEQRASSVDDIYAGEIYTVHAADMSDMIVESTYQTYQRLFIEQAGTVTYEQYEAAVLNFNHFSTAAVELGYDLVSDIYADNMQKCSSNTSALEELDRVGRFLEAYRLTKADHLDAEDEYDLMAAKTYIDILKRHAAHLDLMTCND